MNNLKKNPTYAALLGIFPGLGFLYLGEVKKFLMFFFVCLIAVVMGALGNTMMFLMAFVLDVLGAVYAYTLAMETLKGGITVKVDPWMVLCYSLLWDGAGQFFVKKKKLGMVMSILGLTPCLCAWIYFVPRFGVKEMATVLDGSIYTITNILVLWFIFALPIKILSMIDGFYSAYHLYVAKSK